MARIDGCSNKIRVVEEGECSCGQGSVSSKGSNNESVSVWSGNCSGSRSLAKAEVDVDDDDLSSSDGSWEKIDESIHISKKNTFNTIVVGSVSNSKKEINYISERGAVLENPSGFTEEHVSESILECTDKENQLGCEEENKNTPGEMGLTSIERIEGGYWAESCRSA